MGGAMTEAPAARSRRAICTICVRAGSKGVRAKNTRPLLGRPLFVHSLDQARASGLFDEIAVSSDDPEALAIAAMQGARSVKRPAELATDTAGKIPAIQHCVRAVQERAGATFDLVVDLDATSPLRLPGDIVGAVELLEETNASNVITGAPARRSPYFNMVEIDDTGAARLVKPPSVAVDRRQDAPAVFDMNASIYVWRWNALFEMAGLFGPETRLFVMPEERSVDIDTPLDWKIVEHLMSRAAPGPEGG